jgi:hypothetical protein
MILVVSIGMVVAAELGRRMAERRYGTGVVPEGVVQP